MKKRAFHYFIVAFIFLFAGIKAEAQSTDNQTGYPVVSKNYVDVEGSPYLVDDFYKGSIKLSNGLSYKDALLKYNQVDDAVYFKGNNGEVLAFIQPVNEFTISYSKDGVSFSKHFRNGYPAILNNTDKSFYEILTDGTASLLKRTAKTISETKPYNSATITRSVNEDIKYYLFISGKMNQIKKDKKSILSVLVNKHAELENFIKANNVNIKNDDDLAKLIVYYNSL